MIELRPNNTITAILRSPEQKNDYYFDLAPNQTVTVSFTAPSLEYKVTHAKKELPIDKGDGADAHEGPTIDFTTTETYTFSESTNHRIFLTVTSADGVTLPSDSYTIGLSVAG
jgi:hypothetical protein